MLHQILLFVKYIVASNWMILDKNMMMLVKLKDQFISDLDIFSRLSNLSIAFSSFFVPGERMAAFPRTALKRLILSWYK